MLQIARWYFTRLGVPLGLVIIVGAHISNYHRESPSMEWAGWGGLLLLTATILWILEIWSQVVESYQRAQEKPRAVRTWRTIILGVPFWAAILAIILFGRWLYDPLF
ncbi:hypothetical protein FJY93_04590 [Candidatus Kaiserbacteria bacterium]|nr:hypothetical protein [Candidatus Kaiserbacteria bacterium]